VTCLEVFTTTCGERHVCAYPTTDHEGPCLCSCGASSPSWLHPEPVGTSHRWHRSSTTTRHDPDHTGQPPPPDARPRARSTNPRAIGTNPRAIGTNPRARQRRRHRH